MTKKVRVGMIGAGMMGREHIANVKLQPGVEVVALADPFPASLTMAAALLGDGVKTFESGRDLLAAGDVDAVIIASPNHTHAAELEAVFAAGVHVLCEKPLCHDLADARRIAARAASHPGVVWVGMEYRFMPPAARLIADVHAGRIGRLVMLAIREHRFPFLRKVGDWNRFARNTGGTMVEKCCHFFDLMRHIAQAEAVRVFCSGAMDVNHLDERYDGERPDIIDNSYTVVDFDNGVRAMLDLSMFAEGSAAQEEIVAVGDRAKIEAHIPPGDLIFSPRKPKAPARERIAVDPVALGAGAHFGATFYQLEAFFAAVRGEGPVLVSAEDGLRAVEIGTAAEISAREKRAVELAELRAAHPPPISLVSA